MRFDMIRHGSLWVVSIQRLLKWQWRVTKWANADTQYIHYDLPIVQVHIAIHYDWRY